MIVVSHAHTQIQVITKRLNCPVHSTYINEIQKVLHRLQVNGFNWNGFFTTPFVIQPEIIEVTSSTNPDTSRQNVQITAIKNMFRYVITIPFLFFLLQPTQFSCRRRKVWLSLLLNGLTANTQATTSNQTMEARTAFCSKPFQQVQSRYC